MNIKLIASAAMLSSVEGYASLVVDSIEFEEERKLSADEQQEVFKFVQSIITNAVGGENGNC